MTGGGAEGVYQELLSEVGGLRHNPGADEVRKAHSHPSVALGTREWLCHQFYKACYAVLVKRRRW